MSKPAPVTCHCCTQRDVLCFWKSAEGYNLPHCSTTSMQGWNGPPWLSTLAPAPQKDKNTKLAYACYFLLGSGILAPWNAFITAADYFEAVFPGRHLDRLFTIAYLPVCLLMLGVLIKYNTLPGRPRILASFAGFVLIMVVMPLIDVLLVGDKDTGPDSALLLVLLAVVLVGVLDGLSQGAIFADAAALPPQYTHAVVGGTASSGVIICLLRIFTKAALPATRTGLRTSTAIYFAISGGITLTCWGVYYAVLPQLGVVRYYKQGTAGFKALELSPQPSMGESGALAAEAVLLGCEQVDCLQGPLVRRHSNSGHNLPDFHHAESARPSSHHSSSSQYAQHHTAAAAASIGSSINTISAHPMQHQHQHISLHDSPPHAMDGSRDSLLAAGHQPSEGSTAPAAATSKAHSGRLSWQHVVVEAWHSALAMVLVYVITLSIFPGVLSEDIQSASLGSWYPILLITTFNVSDLLGKNIPFCGLAPRPKTLLAASVLRVVFIPAFLLAGKYAASAAALMAVLTISLGFTNGLLTALLMTLAPASVDAGEEGLVENIMVFALVLGLTLGAFAGWLWLL